MQIEKGENETLVESIQTQSQPVSSSTIETNLSPNPTPNVRDPEVRKRYLIEVIGSKSDFTLIKQPSSISQ